MLSGEMPCSSQQLNSQRGHNVACSSENSMSVAYRFLERISPSRMSTPAFRTPQRAHFLSPPPCIPGGLSVEGLNSRLRRNSHSVLSSCTPISAGATTSTGPPLAHRLQEPPKVMESDCAATASWRGSIISSAARPSSCVRVAGSARIEPLECPTQVRTTPLTGGSGSHWSA